MTITLHTVSGAPRGWRVLIGLALKGLEWDTHILQLSKNEHRSAPFLSLNPRGTVPVLEADGLVLRDSIGILAWLDRQYPDNPLFGKTADEAAQIWQVTLEACDYLREAGKNLLTPVLVQAKPLPAAGTAERETLNTAAQSMHAECRWLEDLLEGKPFLAGNVPSAAEAVAFPEIRLVQRAVETRFEFMAPLGFEDPQSLYPNIIAWMTRVAALPGMEKTMPPHWQEKAPAAQERSI